jgi:DNA repair exonuclease SbcCD nuclease subunit
MTIRLIWRTDVHLSDKTPARRTGNWTDDVINKLSWIGKKAEEINADAVLDGGDFFDVKSPTKNSHALVRRACEVHKKYPCPVYALVGNHDVKYGDIEYLPEQPLGVLFSSQVFLQFGDEKEIVFEKEGVKVRIVGIPYHGVEYDFDRLKSLKKKDEDYLLVACHLLARKGKTGSMFENEDIVGYDFLNTISEVDVWFFGHWHKDQGITKLKNGAHVVNVGSLTRGALHLDDLDRKPCVVEVSANSKEIKCVRHNVPVLDSEIAFKLEEALREREDLDRMVEIVDKMKSISKEGWASMTLKEQVMGIKSIPNEVKEMVLFYLDEIS